MKEELEILNKRITAINKELQDNSSYFNKASDYIYSDPQSSLTKSRIILEKLLQDLFLTLMEEKPARSMIGQILSNKSFASKIPQRILFRMNAIREMSNLGPHGGIVEPIDAVRVLQNLLDVIEWHIIKYPQKLDMRFAQEIERQIQVMMGFPESYYGKWKNLFIPQLMWAQCSGTTCPGSVRG